MIDRWQRLVLLLDQVLCCLCLAGLQGTVVMLCALPIALAKHIYGPDAGEFRPSRWLSSSSTDVADRSASPAGSDDTNPQRDTAAGAAAAAGAGGHKAAAGSVSAALPDPLTFMSGPRDW